MSDPRVRGRVPDGRDHRFAHLRKDVNVLMAVHEIGRTPEGGREGLDLRADLDRDLLRLELAQHRRAQRRRERQKSAGPQRAIAGRQRPEWRGQRYMQPDRELLRAGFEDHERGGFGAVKGGCDDHHRRRIDASAQQELADGIVHAGEIP
jgi:hypothetical protein